VSLSREGGREREGEREKRRKEKGGGRESVWPAYCGAKSY